MKKILVLTLMMLLGMYVMASDVTISGETLFEWYHDFGQVYNYNADAELVVKAVVDDYNTANVDFDYAQDASGSPSTITLDRGYFVTAIGKYAGLDAFDVSIDLTWGYNEYDDESYAQITVYEIADIWEAKFESWGFGVDIGVMDIVHFEVALAPQPNDSAGINGELDTIIGAYGGMDPVWVQVYFIRENEALEAGNIGVTLLFAMDIVPGMFALEAQASLDFDLDEDIEVDDGLPGEKYMWSAAVATTIMEMAYVDVGVIGQDESMLKLLFLNLGIGYQDMVGVDVGVGMVLDDEVAPEMLDEIEASVWTKVGAGKFRVGYYMRFDQGLAGNQYPGVFVPADGNYDPAVAESGVIYFSGELDY